MNTEIVIDVPKKKKTAIYGLIQSLQIEMQ